MKTKLLSIASFILFFLFPLFISAQEKSVDFIDGGEYKIEVNDAQHPCISAREYAILEKEVAENVKRLGLENTSKSVLTTSLIWPLQPASGFSQCDYHFIGAYVDQNTAASAFKDFNCGANSYDGHQGTDIAIWPYSLYKMDNSQIEVVAAASGTIVQRADGNFDRNCSGNSLTANSIIIQHSDGSYAYYWHMKNGSITTKTVGQTVVAGEKIGVVGSSGSSSGPHLHFEVRTAATANTYNDPFSGSCNTVNANSWWASQKLYSDPAVIKVSVHTTDMTLATCPNSDVPNEADSFAIPYQGSGLPPGYAKFYIFLRELPMGAVVDLKILNPDSSIFKSWTYSPSATYKTSYWGFSKLLPTIAGTYTFIATYNGVSCSKTFDITTPLSLPDFSNADQFKVYPNPSNTSFNVMAQKVENGTYKFSLCNINGQLIKENKVEIGNNSLQNSFSISELSDGMYFLTISNEKYKTVKKIVKQH